MGLSEKSGSLSADFMSCSVNLVVMPHSATSRVSGDEISTIVSWNSGVYIIQNEMWAYIL